MDAVRVHLPRVCDPDVLCRSLGVGVRDQGRDPWVGNEMNDSERDLTLEAALSEIDRLERENAELRRELSDASWAAENSESELRDRADYDWK